ncbi:hypothetical protein LLG46_15500 [bacterium]|nr:hypothetical protein [bacterium]
MSNKKSFPLSVCIFPEPGPNAARTVSYPNYIHEILKHAGLCYSSIDVDDIAGALDDIKLLLTVGEYTLPDELADRLRNWIKYGGALVSIGGICGLADVFGVQPELPTFSRRAVKFSTLGEGYLDPDDKKHQIIEHLDIPLHFFNGISVIAEDAQVIARVLDAHHRSTSHAGVTERKYGDGRCILIASDITGSVVRIQQGVGVTRDGVSAPDGTASICDNALKSGDGGVLDWFFDREQVVGMPGYSAFTQPVADQLRELLIRSILYLASDIGLTIPLLWLYPRNLPAVAHLSHDSDNNNIENAQRMLEILNEADIHSTWCIIMPGYPENIIDDIRKSGHELAMHFDAMSGHTNWSEEEFDKQWRGLLELFGGKKPISNKNHFLRWEGDVEFFEWCERHNIMLDQSKGGSKAGDSGFTFGTCHVYFPVDFREKTLDVLELPTLTQDLTISAPAELAAPLIAAALKHHGIFHPLFHPAHVLKEDVAAVLQKVIADAKSAGLEWFTAEQINSWERARRSVEWSDYHVLEDGVSVVVEATSPLKDASLMWLTADDAQIDIDESNSDTSKVIRWGFRFVSTLADLQPGSKRVLRLNSRY